jgi:leucyl-tRNA synthetase
VSTEEPFQRLFNQGYILAAAYTDERGVYVDADEVEERDGEYFFRGERVQRESGKMGKSLRNAVAPDDIYRDYGADTLRLYEMFMGPLDASRPWNTSDIVGVHRFLQRLWRNLVDEDTGEVRVSSAPADDETRRVLHKTIDAVGRDLADLHFNTAVARLFELNNRLTQVVQQGTPAPTEVAEAMVLMVAPLAPHIAEELWSRLGHPSSLAYEPFPQADPQWLATETVEVPVQVNGKVRARIAVPTYADEAATEALARSEPRIAELVAGATVRKVVVVPGRMVNFVLA